MCYVCLVSWPPAPSPITPTTGLVAFDAIENSLSVWSLARTVQRATHARFAMARSPASVSPASTLCPQLDDNGCNIPRCTAVHNSALRRTTVRRFHSVVLEKKVRRVTQKRRRTTLHSAIESMANKEGEEVLQTAYFIIATILLREVVEIVVPIQTMLVLSATYMITGPSGVNGLVQGMDDNDYYSAMWYLAADTGVELLVFFATVVALWFILPETSAFRVILGLVEQHFATMVVLLYSAWGFALAVQSTYFGMDLTFQFEWMHLSNCENATWVGGLVWEGGC